MKILLVDDEKGLLEQAKIYLERIGEEIEVIPVSSAEEALEMMDEDDFDEIVSDYQMPDIDGLDFLREVREERESDIPFIMFTGKGREEVAMNALNLGADRYLQKGGDPSAQYSVLAQAIEQEIGHHRTERDLRKSEKRYRKLVESTGDIIIKHDENGEIEFANQAGLDFAGYSEEEVKGKNIIDFLPEEEIPGLIERKKKRIERDKNSFNFETTFINRDGKKIDVDVEATPLFEEGEYKGDLVIARDMTKLKRSEQKLKEREERYRRLFETAQDGMLIIDAETGIIEDANPFIQDILGYSKEELVGKELWKLGTFKSIIENKRRFKKLVEKGYIRYDDKPLETKDGEEVPVEFVSNTYEAGGKKVVQCNIREISERKKASEKVKEKNEELRWMLDSMMNAYVLFESVFDEDGNFVSYRFEYINNAYEEMTGVKLEDVKGKTVHEVWPETEQEWIERYGEVAVTGESQTFDLYHGPTDKTYHCAVYRPYDTKEKFCVIFEDVSERKEKEQKLRKERKKFQEIFNNANDAIYLNEITEYGTPGRFIEVNDTAVEMLGYSRDEFLEMSPADIDAEGKFEASREMMDEGDARFETVHQAKDGTKIPVELHNHIFELEGEKRVLSVVRDITERKEAEKRFRKLVDESPVGIWEEDFSRVKEKIDGLKDRGIDDIDEYLEDNPEFVRELMSDVDIISVNDAVLEMYKAGSLEEFEDGLSKIFSEKSIPPFKKLVKQIAKGETKFQTDKVDKRLDGEDVHIFLKWSVLSGYEDTYERVIVTTIDITDRKMMEEELRESTERLERIIEEAPFPTMLHAEDGEVVNINEVWTEITGYDAEDILTISDWTEKAYEEKKREVEKHVESLHEEQGRNTEGEFEIITKDGEKRVWDFMSTNIGELPDGRSLVLSMAQDITERKKAEERKEFLNTLLRQDLRSKCQTIQGYFQLLEDEADLPEKHIEYLEKSMKAGREADEILNLAKKLEEIEVSRWTTEKDIINVLRHVIDDISILVEREGVQIEENYPEGIEKVKGDYSLKTLLNQLLVSRIQNSGCNKIKIDVKEREEDILLSIDDNGKRLPEDIKNLFSGDVYTGKTAGEGGIRYYMIREIAEHNNCSIEMKDSDMGGARFEVTLKKVSKC